MCAGSRPRQHGFRAKDCLIFVLARLAISGEVIVSWDEALAAVGTEDNCANRGGSDAFAFLQLKAKVVSDKAANWEDSVLAAWAKEPACASTQLEGMCGTAAVVVSAQLGGMVAMDMYTAGAGGAYAPFAKDVSTKMFPIASNTKVLTSILLQSLVDAGKASMNETVGSFLGNECSLPSAVEEITLFQLASQTSGLPAQPTNRHMGPCASDPTNCNPFTEYTVTDLCETLKVVELGPKGDYIYSNLAYGMLGYLLDLRMGKPYEQLVQEWVLQPLGMNSTKIELTDSEWLNLVPQGREKETGKPLWRRQPYGILQGNGAFLSTLQDMGRLLASTIHAVNGLDGPLAAELRQSLVPVAWSGFCAAEACEEEQLLNLDIPTAERGIVALGWESSSAGLLRTWHKAGDVGGYSSWMEFNAQTGRGAFGVDSCGGCGSELGSLRGSATQNMVRILADGPPQQVIPLPDVKNAELSALTGNFAACSVDGGTVPSTSLVKLVVRMQAAGSMAKLLVHTESINGTQSKEVTAVPFSSAAPGGTYLGTPFAYSGVALSLSESVGTIHGTNGPLSRVQQKRMVHFLASAHQPHKIGAAVLLDGGADIFFVTNSAECP